MNRHSRSLALALGLLCLFSFDVQADGFKYTKQSLDSVSRKGSRTSKAILTSRYSVDTDTIYIDSSGTEMIFNDGANTNVTLTTLAAGGAPADATYITQTANGTLTNEQALTSLSSGVLSSDSSTGVLSSVTVQVGSGGTGLTSGNSGGIPAFTNTKTITSSATLTDNAVVIGGGSGAVPETITADTATTGHFLASTATSPAFRQIQSSDMAGVFDVGDGATGISTYAKGDLLVGTTSGVLAKLTVGSNGQVLSADSAQTLGVKWATPSSGGGSGTPGGSTGQIQYNNAGAFGGASLISTDSTGLRLSIGPGTGTVSLDVGGSFRTVPFQLTDAASIDLDASKSNFFYVTLGGNRTLANPTNTTFGQRIILMISQDATGSRKLGFGTSYKFGTDVPSYDSSTTATTKDYIGMIFNGTSMDVVSISKGYR